MTTGESVMDIIERAARAMAISAGLNEVHWPDYTDRARAVLSAMREPTPKMIAATWGHKIDNLGGIESQNTRNERIWQAMIDQALKG